MADRRVLHLLPHPGGGGETYLDTLERMPGYRSTRTYLARGPTPSDAFPGLLTSAPRAILTSRHHDLIHVHGEVAAAFCLPALAARPSVVTLHGSHLIRRAQGYRRRLAELNLRLLVRTAGRTICVATTEYDELVATSGRRRQHVRSSSATASSFLRCRAGSSGQRSALSLVFHTTASPPPGLAASSRSRIPSLRSWPRSRLRGREPG